MSGLSAYTDCLPLEDSKKLLAAMQKPGKGGEWVDWSGEGGVETEEEMHNVSIPDLLEWKVPEFCSSYWMRLSEVIRPAADLPDEPWIGGDSFNLPEYGDRVSTRATVVLRRLNYPITLSVGRTSGMRHYDRSYNEGCWIRLSFPKMAIELKGLTHGEFPNKAMAREVVESLRGRFGVPEDQCPGMLEYRVVAEPEMGEFELTLELSYSGELKTCFMAMLRHLPAESPCPVYGFRTSVDFGGSAKFKGEMHNVSPVIRDLLPRVAEANDFSGYDITYYPLGPRSWKDREKSRKKLKEPGREQLGTLTLENGAVAQVTMVIEKEGYRFHLNFGSDDDLIKFYESKLFQKAKWHSGAE